MLTMLFLTMWVSFVKVKLLVIDVSDNSPVFKTEDDGDEIYVRVE